MIARVPSQRRLNHPSRTVRFATMASLTASLMLGACSDTADLLPTASLAKTETGSNTESTSAASQTELQKATAYWGEQYSKNPADLQAALNYAKDLKAQGDKEKAMGVLQQASMMHSDDRELASEYGRLALDFGQVATADQLLKVADDPEKPDWKIISARGTVMAKQGRYSDAITFFERAASLSPNNATVLNNLAMAHAMMGDPKKAEEILRQAMASENVTPKVRENLALVLGLQGRYDEAKAVTAGVIDADAASSNAKYLKQLVNDTSSSPEPRASKIATKAVAKPVAPTAWKTSVSSAVFTTE